MRRWAAAFLLLLPFGVVPVFVGWVADRQATRIGAGLSALGEAMSDAEPRHQEEDREEVARWRAQLAGSWDELSSSEGSLGPSPKAPTARGSALRRGVYVTAQKVLALARAGARPSGIRVGPQGSRPGGLMLIGVSGLGVGLRDGDILIQAAGQPAVSEESVVAAVVKARGARRAQISGRVWRDGTSFPLVVAQPYVGPG